MSRKPHKYWLTRHFLVQQLSKMGLHIDLLCDAGLIEVMNTSVEDGLKDFDITRLTLAGYEYLDAVRNIKVWSRVKKTIDFVGGATLDIIKQMAVKELSKELGLG